MPRRYKSNMRYDNRYLTPEEKARFEHELRIKQQADYLAWRTGQEVYNAFFGGRVSAATFLAIILGLAAFGGAVLYGVWYFTMGQFH